MSVKKTLFISSLSDLPSSERYYTSKKYDSMEYVRKSKRYFIIGSIIGFFFAWISTQYGNSIHPGMNIAITRVIIVLMFGYMGFSFHAGISLFDPHVNIVTIFILTFTGLIILVLFFSIAIGIIIAIPRFIINVRRIYK